MSRRLERPQEGSRSQLHPNLVQLGPILDGSRAFLTCVLRCFFNIAALRLKSPKVAPRRLQERAKRPQDGSKMAPRGTQGGPRGSQDGPRGAPEGFETAPRPLRAGSKPRREAVALRCKMRSNASPETRKKKPLSLYRNRGIYIYIYNQFQKLKKLCQW